MFSKIKLSLSHINYKLFAALLVLGLAPTIYTTVRVFFLGQLPGEWSFSIAGQLSWVNLLYEILNEAIILPLFYFIGKIKDDKDEFSNRVRTGMLISLGVYAVFSVVMFLFAEPMLNLMATDTSIIDASASYIRIESIANIFSILTQFSLVALVTVNKSKYLYALTGAKLLLCLVSDTFLVSTLPVSADLGVNGIGYSNIIVNALLLVVSLVLLSKEGIKVFGKAKLNFVWTKEFAKVGGISGVESLIRNVAYMVMIARMVNVVGEQGTYWVANNFIWGWLLLPVLQLGELIKQEVSGDKENVRRNSLGYFVITAFISVLWFATIPLWKPFMTHVLCFTDVDKLFSLVMLLVGFYVLYAIQNVCDAIFYGLGKTNYMLLESVATNVIYYGFSFVLYATHIWTPTLIGIALLFGIGNAFDSIVSFTVYTFLLKKEKINIFNMYFAKSEHIKKLDKLVSEKYGIPVSQLMENAGRSIFDEIKKSFSTNKFAVFCGKGNNGGDGFVVARLLKEDGRAVKVYLACEESEIVGASRIAFDNLKETNVKILSVLDDVDNDAIIIDALLGISVSGAPRGKIKTAVERIITMNNTVVSVDVPSGLSADDGKAEGSVIKADFTYTLALDKVGLNASPGRELCGRKKVLDIGIPEEAIKIIMKQIIDNA